MCACPWTTFFFSRRLVFFAFGFAIGPLSVWANARAR
jgi:hypothetical protein